MKEPEEQPHVFKNISELMRHLGHPKPVHPLVALIDYKDSVDYLENISHSFIMDFYKISFKTKFNGRVKYGKGYYDFEEGGLAFLAPHQIIHKSGEEKSYEGYSLFFHPDLIRAYSLGKTINRYGFFSYDVSEALFLSDKEKRVISSLFESINNELQNTIDHFTQDVLVSQIELLLTYSNRFYNRQFITRKVVYHELIEKMDLYLAERFNSNETVLSGLPTVKEISDYLHVSPRYLTDILKSLTGQSTQQHIHDRLIETAKDILSTSDLTISEIAYHLGFEHSQSFNKLFKQKTNLSPVAFRRSFN